MLSSVKPKTKRLRLSRFLLNVVLGLTVFFTVDRGGSALLLAGLDQYYGLQAQNALLVVGHSHVVLGIDRVRLEKQLGTPVSLYARAGATLDQRILMVEHYMERQPAGPRAVIFGVDGHLFSERGLSSNAHMLFLPHMDDPVVADYLRRHVRDLRELVSPQSIHLDRYNDVLINAARRGWQQDWVNVATGRFNPDLLAMRAERGLTRPITIDADEVARFDAFLAEAEAQSLPVVLTFIPTAKEWNALEPEQFSKVLAIFQESADQYEMVDFLDLRDPWSLNPNLFVDPVHLNARGQRLVTDDLSEYLRRRLVPND